VCVSWLLLVDDQPLTSGVTVYNSVEDREWRYYHIAVDSLQVLNIRVYQEVEAPPTQCDVDVVCGRCVVIWRCLRMLHASMLINASCWHGA
jgi:hypothetical protein